MNILTESLPLAIEIDGIEYEINSGFRSCLRIILAFEDNELADAEKRMILLNNLYKTMPHDITQAIKKGIRFLDGGKDSGNGESNGESELRLYSFEQDASYIMAAFKQTHGIDLDAVEMHWWKFLALFMDLGSETTFSSLVSLRKRVKTGKATKEERAVAREIKETFDLPDIDRRTPEEREAEAHFMELVATGKKQHKQDIEYPEEAIND